MDRAGAHLSVRGSLEVSPDDAHAPWVRTLVRWVHSRVSSDTQLLGSALSGLDLSPEGLLQLVEVVKGESLNKKLLDEDGTEMNTLTNFNVVLRCTKQELKTSGIRIPSSVSANNLASLHDDAVLEFLYCVAMHFYIQAFDAITDKSTAGEAGLQHHLREWIAQHVGMVQAAASQEANPILDFTQSFTDGTALLALALSADASPAANYNPSGDPRTDFRHAIESAHKLGAAKLVEEDEFQIAPQHERMMVLYLCEVVVAVDKQLKKSIRRRPPARSPRSAKGHTNQFAPIQQGEHHSPHSHSGSSSSSSSGFTEPIEASPRKGSTSHQQHYASAAGASANVARFVSDLRAHPTPSHGGSGGGGGGGNIVHTQAGTAKRFIANAGGMNPSDKRNRSPALRVSTSRSPRRPNRHFGDGSSSGDPDRPPSPTISESSMGSCSAIDEYAPVERPEVLELKQTLFAAWLNAILLDPDLETPPEGHLKDLRLIKTELPSQIADPRVLLALFEAMAEQRFNKQLATSNDKTAQLANMTIVLRLIKKQLRPYVKVRSSAQKDIMAGKQNQVLNLLYTMIGSSLVGRLQEVGYRVDRVSDLPNAVLGWSSAILADAAQSSETSRLVDMHNLRMYVTGPRDAAPLRRGSQGRDSSQDLPEVASPGGTSDIFRPSDDFRATTYALDLGSAWSNGRLLLVLVLRVGQLWRKHSSILRDQKHQQQLQQQGDASAAASPSSGLPEIPYIKVMVRDMNEWKRLLSSEAPDREVCWATALTALYRCFHVPQLLDHSSDEVGTCWKSQQVMAVLIAEFMIRGYGFTKHLMATAGAGGTATRPPSTPTGSLSTHDSSASSHQHLHHSHQQQQHAPLQSQHQHQQEASHHNSNSNTATNNNIAPEVTHELPPPHRAQGPGSGTTPRDEAESPTTPNTGNSASSIGSPMARSASFQVKRQSPRVLHSTASTGNLHRYAQNQDSHFPMSPHSPAQWRTMALASQAEVSALTQRCKESEDRENELAGRVSKLEGELKRARTQLENAVTNRNTAQQRLEEVRASIHVEHNRAEDLRRQLREAEVKLEKEAERSKEAIQAARDESRSLNARVQILEGELQEARQAFVEEDEDGAGSGGGDELDEFHSPQLSESHQEALNDTTTAAAATTANAANTATAESEERFGPPMIDTSYTPTDDDDEAPVTPNSNSMGTSPRHRANSLPTSPRYDPMRHIKSLEEEVTALKAQLSVNTQGLYAAEDRETSMSDEVQSLRRQLRSLSDKFNQAESEAMRAKAKVTKFKRRLAEAEEHSEEVEDDRAMRQNLEHQVQRLEAALLKSSRMHRKEAARAAELEEALMQREIDEGGPDGEEEGGEHAQYRHEYYRAYAEEGVGQLDDEEGEEVPGVVPGQYGDEDVDPNEVAEQILGQEEDEEAEGTGGLVGSRRVSDDEEDDELVRRQHDEAASWRRVSGESDDSAVDMQNLDGAERGSGGRGVPKEGYNEVDMLKDRVVELQEDLEFTVYQLEESQRELAEVNTLVNDREALTEYVESMRAALQQLEEQGGSGLTLEMVNQNKAYEQLVQMDDELVDASFMLLGSTLEMAAYRAINGKVTEPPEQSDVAPSVTQVRQWSRIFEALAREIAEAEAQETGEEPQDIDAFASTVPADLIVTRLATACTMNGVTLVSQQELEKLFADIFAPMTPEQRRAVEEDPDGDDIIFPPEVPIYNVDGFTQKVMEQIQMAAAAPNPVARKISRQSFGQLAQLMQQQQQGGAMAGGVGTSEGQAIPALSDDAGPDAALQIARERQLELRIAELEGELQKAATSMEAEGPQVQEQGKVEAAPDAPPPSGIAEVEAQALREAVEKETAAKLELERLMDTLKEELQMSQVRQEREGIEHEKQLDAEREASSTLRHQLSTHQEELEGLKELLQQSQDRVRAFEAERAAQEATAAASADESNSKHREALDTMLRDLESAREQSQSLLQTVDEERSQVRELQVALKEHQDTEQQKEGELATMRQTVDELKAQLERAKEDAAAAVAAERASGLPGVLAKAQADLHDDSVVSLPQPNTPTDLEGAEDALLGSDDDDDDEDEEDLDEEEQIKTVEEFLRTVDPSLGTPEVVTRFLDFGVDSIDDLLDASLLSDEDLQGPEIQLTPDQVRAYRNTLAQLREQLDAELEDLEGDGDAELDAIDEKFPHFVGFTVTLKEWTVEMFDDPDNEDKFLDEISRSLDIVAPSYVVIVGLEAGSAIVDTEVGGLESAKEAQAVMADMEYAVRTGTLLSPADFGPAEVSGVRVGEREVKMRDPSTNTKRRPASPRTASPRNLRKPTAEDAAAVAAAAAASAPASDSTATVTPPPEAQDEEAVAQVGDEERRVAQGSSPSPSGGEESAASSATEAQELNDKVKQLTQELEAAQNQIIDLVCAQDPSSGEFHARLTELSDRVQTQEEELYTLRSENMKLASSQEDDEDERNATRAQVEALTKQVSDLEAELEALKEGHSALESEHAETLEELKLREKEVLEAASNRIVVQESAAGGAGGRGGGDEGDQDGESGGGLQEALQELHDQIEDKDAEIRELEDELQETKSRLSEASNRARRAVETMDSSTTELRDAESARKEAVAQLSGVKVQVEELKKERDEAVAKTEKLRLELQRQRDRVVELAESSRLRSSEGRLSEDDDGAEQLSPSLFAAQASPSKPMAAARPSATQRSKSFSSYDDKRRKRVEAIRSRVQSIEEVDDDYVAGLIGGNAQSNATGWKGDEIASWNEQVRAFARLHREVTGLHKHTDAYLSGMRKAVAAESEVTHTFLDMVGSTGNDRVYLADAESFKQVAIELNASLLLSTFRDMEEDLNVLNMSSAQLAQLQDKILFCDELHMELIHYADKLKDLRQGRRRSLGFQGSALNRNADKHSALVKEFNKECNEVRQMLAALDVDAFRRRVLDNHLGRAEALHKAMGEEMHKYFESLEPRPYGESIEADEDGGATSSRKLAADKGLGVINKGAVQDKTKQVLANKGPVRASNDGFSAADANRTVKRGSAASKTAMFEQQNKEHEEYQAIVSGEYARRGEEDDDGYDDDEY